MLPQEFCNEMKNLLKEDYDKYIKSFEDNPKRGLLLNSNLMDKNKIILTLPLKISALKYNENGFLLESENKLGNTWYHHAGLVYLQEPSSMAPATLFKDLENKSVLDLCASPGGKTSNLALFMKNSGLLVSNEIVPSRAKILFSNVERLGFSNVVVTNNSPFELETEFPNFFDCVLVDAPCSGEGMFRKDPKTISEWNYASVKSCHIRQKEILLSADKMLKNGGYLVYSTCTFNLSENEQTLLFLINDLGYEAIESNLLLNNFTENGIELEKNKNLKYAKRFYPISNVGEGQFMCLLKKVQNCNQNNEKTLKKCKNSKNSLINGSKISKNEEKLVIDFINKTTKGLSFKNFYKIGDYICGNNFTQLQDKNVKFLNLTIIIGTLKKDRIEPHHHFFKTCSNYFINKIELTKQQVKDYLFGSELEIDKNLKGFGCVFYDGIVLGGGKCVLGKFKNYYPKGLRAKIEDF